MKYSKMSSQFCFPKWRTSVADYRTNANKMSGKTTRKVTVEASSRLSTDDQSSKMKKRSVFERLGTASGVYETADKCRTFMREGECPYGKKCKYSHDIGQDSKMNRKTEKLYMDRPDADYGHYESVRKSPEKKKEKRKFLDAEKLKIEFKKDSILKSKHSIEQLYEEEAPTKKSRKEKKDKGEIIPTHSKVKKSYVDDNIMEKEGHFRNVQLKGEEKKERKIKNEGKSSEVVKDDELATHSKKSKKKKYQEESEEESKYRETVEVISSKKKKKKKEKTKYSSSESESEDEKTKKKKTKKEKHKSYESDESSTSKQRKKNKNNDYEKQIEVQSLNEMKKKKKKKKDKYESENDEELEKEVYAKPDKVREEEKSKKSSKYIEEDTYTGKSSQYDYDHTKKKKSKSTHNTSPNKNEKVKEQVRGSTSWSISSELSSIESDDEINERKSSKKNKHQDKTYKEEKKKEKEKKSDKYDDLKVSHKRSYEESKDTHLHDERKREYKTETHSRGHYSEQQHQQQHHMSANQEAGYESWDRDRSTYDDRGTQSGQRGTPVSYGRGRGQTTYKARYDSHNKSNEERQQYRQYSDQQYSADDTRYRNRGARDDYGHHTYRRGTYPDDDQDGYQGGRSKDFYQGYSQGNQSEDRHRYRGDYPSSKEVESANQRDRKKERRGHTSRSPNSRRRTQSPFEGEDETDSNRPRTKKRKRDQSLEKDHSTERKGKKAKTDSDVQSPSEDEMKSENNKKQTDRDKRSKGHRDGYYKRDETVDERRDRRSDKESRERDRRYKRGSSNERSRRERNTSRSDKRDESLNRDESQGNKVEDKRVKSLRASHGRNSPSDRSENESGTKTQRKSSSKGRNNTADGSDNNLDDVYEKISDEELDFFDDENSKSQKPASLEDVDWGALAAIAPASKRDKEEEGSSLMAKHSAINVLSRIGFSSNLLSKKALETIKEKTKNENERENENKEKLDFINFAGTGSFVLSKIRQQKHRRNLVSGLNKNGNVLSMRKDIEIRKELSLPPQKLGMNGSLFNRAPSSPADREMFLASASLFKKIPPGEEQSSCKIIKSLVGSVIQCC